MRLAQVLAGALTLCSSASAQTWTSVKYYDRDTGITFSSSTLPSGVTYRVALPVTSSASDAIIQIVSPNTCGWAGMAWGGRMTNNPLSVAWATKSSSGQKALVSSRMAFGYNAVPSAYTGATYTLIKAPTTNSTHWTITARCQGCTRWTTNTGDSTNLDTMSETTFAYACSTASPVTPSSNTSAFAQHDQEGLWTHNLALARNASFSQWVQGHA